MRYRLTILMLLLLLVVLMLHTMLPVMNVLAAPAPDPYAILDIGPTPKGKTAAQHLKEQIAFMTNLDTLNRVCSDPEVRKLPSVIGIKDARPWLAKNLRATPEDIERLLCLTFRGGKRNEQASILNAFLRVRLLWLPQGPTDTLVSNPPGDNYDSSVASNWYDKTIGRQLEDGEPGPGPGTPIIFSGTPNSPTSKNAPITWHDPVIPKTPIGNFRPTQYTVIRWAR